MTDYDHIFSHRPRTVLKPSESRSLGVRTIGMVSAKSGERVRGTDVISEELLRKAS